MRLVDWLILFDPLSVFEFQMLGLFAQAKQVEAGRKYLDILR
jgi:hypothetical protein